MARARAVLKEDITGQIGSRSSFQNSRRNRNINDWQSYWFQQAPHPVCLYNIVSVCQSLMFLSLLKWSCKDGAKSWSECVCVSPCTMYVASWKGGSSRPQLGGRPYLWKCLYWGTVASFLSHFTRSRPIPSPREYEVSLWRPSHSSTVARPVPFSTAPFCTAMIMEYCRHYSHSIVTNLILACRTQFGERPYLWKGWCYEENISENVYIDDRSSFFPSLFMCSRPIPRKYVVWWQSHNSTVALAVPFSTVPCCNTASIRYCWHYSH